MKWRKCNEVSALRDSLFSENDFNFDYTSSINIEMKSMQIMQQAQKDAQLTEDIKENRHPTFEVQAEGGLATTTPRSFKLRPSDVEKEAQRLGEETEAHYRVRIQLTSIIYICMSSNIFLFALLFNLGFGRRTRTAMRISSKFFERELR